MLPLLLPQIGRGENRCRRRGTGRQCAQRRAAEPAHLRALRRSACHVPDRRRSGVCAAGIQPRGRRASTAPKVRRRIMTRRGSAAPERRAREGAAGPRNPLLAAAAARLRWVSAAQEPPEPCAPPSLGLLRRHSEVFHKGQELCAQLHASCRTEGRTRIASPFHVAHGACVRAGKFMKRPGTGLVSQGACWRGVVCGCWRRRGAFHGGRWGVFPHPPALLSPTSLTPRRPGPAADPARARFRDGRGGERACSRTATVKGPRGVVGGGACSRPWPGQTGPKPTGPKAQCLTAAGRLGFNALDGRGRGPSAPV